MSAASSPTARVNKSLERVAFLTRDARGRSLELRQAGSEELAQALTQPTGNAMKNHSLDDIATAALTLTFGAAPIAMLLVVFLGAF